MGPSWLSCIQWNLSIVGTIEHSWLSCIERCLSPHRPTCTQLYVVGTADSVRIREVALIQSVLYREVPLYCFLSLPLSSCRVGQPPRPLSTWEACHRWGPALYLSPLAGTYVRMCVRMYMLYVCMCMHLHTLKDRGAVYAFFCTPFL